MVLLNSSEIQEKINIIQIQHRHQHNHRLTSLLGCADLKNLKLSADLWTEKKININERISFGFIGIHTKGNLYYKYGDTFGFIQNFMFRMFCSNIMLC